MFSKAAMYAIKTVLYLAVHGSEAQKIMVKDIAELINVPKDYIAKLLQQLSKRHIISSTKGSKGGFYLNGNNRNATIIDIVNVIDG